MTASPAVTPTDAANRAAPISFARWALGVLVPLLAYVALVFVLMGERSWSVGAYLVPIVYVAVFIYRYGILNGCRRAHAVAAAAFVALTGVACFVFPVLEMYDLSNSLIGRISKGKIAADAPCDPSRGSLDRIPGKVGVTNGCLDRAYPVNADTHYM